MSVISVGISRSSNALSLDRSLNSIYSINQKIDKLNQQILTEQRYTYGSESPFEASVSISVQMQIERKTQNATNLQSTQSYLSASDSSLSQITSMMDEIRSMALEAINSSTSSAQRNTLASSVSTKLASIFDFSNQKYNNRHLFSGATTDTAPFTWGSGSYTVNYSGSVTDLYSWTDSYLLSQTNINGADVFGAVSAPVEGSDLDPTLTGATLLSSLNRGQGIQNGTFRISYVDSGGVQESIVDTSGCVTVDDLRNRISQSAPPGTKIDVGIDGGAISLSFTSKDPKGAITITETGNSLTARSLGIASKTAIPSGTKFTGTDLDPALTGATRLQDVLGSKAQTKLSFPGYNNDILIKAAANGETFTDAQGNEIPLNGMQIQFQSRNEIQSGTEYAEYDADSNSVTVYINPDYTTASNIVSAINKASEADGIPPINAELDTMDQRVYGKLTAASGTGLVTLLPGTTMTAGTLDGGSGAPLDLQSGLQVLNGGTLHTIDLSGCLTVDDLLAVLNDPQYGLVASINGVKNGINIQSRISGADFTIGENGGTTASQLGLRTLDESTFLSELDFNRGVTDFEGPGVNASAQYQAESSNSGMIITAKNEGKDWNDYQIIYTQTDDPNGEVTIDWNQDEKTITIGINPGVSKACEVVTAFNELPGPSEAFEMQLDGTLGINTGQGVVYDGKTLTAGGEDGGVDFVITCGDGTVMEIDIAGAKTLGDILDIINNHPLNADGLLQASLVNFGNGISLVDNSPGDGTLRIERTELSTAAIQLGLIPEGAEYATAALSEDGSSRLDGTDPNPLETESIFTAMIRLQSAMENDNIREIERATNLLDQTLKLVDSGRADLGVRQSTLDAVQYRLEDEYVQLEQTLSSTLKLDDLAGTILQYNSAKVSYEALLQVTSQMFQMSLLNFL